MVGIKDQSKPSPYIICWVIKSGTQIIQVSNQIKLSQSLCIIESYLSIVRGQTTLSCISVWRKTIKPGIKQIRKSFFMTKISFPIMIKPTEEATHLLYPP